MAVAGKNILIFLSMKATYFSTPLANSHLEIAISIVAPTLRPAVARFEF